MLWFGSYDCCSCITFWWFIIIILSCYYVNQAIIIENIFFWERQIFIFINASYTSMLCTYALIISRSMISIALASIIILVIIVSPLIPPVILSSVPLVRMVASVVAAIVPAPWVLWYPPCLHYWRCGGLGIKNLHKFLVIFCVTVFKFFFTWCQELLIFSSHICSGGHV